MELSACPYQWPRRRCAVTQPMYAPQLDRRHAHAREVKGWAGGESLLGALTTEQTGTSVARKLRLTPSGSSMFWLTQPAKWRNRNRGPTQQLAFKCARTIMSSCSSTGGQMQFTFSVRAFATMLHGKGQCMRCGIWHIRIGGVSLVFWSHDFLTRLDGGLGQRVGGWVGGWVD